MGSLQTYFLFQVTNQSDSDAAANVSSTCRMRVTTAGRENLHDHATANGYLGYTAHAYAGLGSCSRVDSSRHQRGQIVLLQVSSV